MNRYCSCRTWHFGPGVLRLDSETGEPEWYHWNFKAFQCYKHDGWHGRRRLDLKTKWKMIKIAYDAMLKGRDFMEEARKHFGAPDNIIIYVLNQAVKYEDLYNDFHSNTDETGNVAGAMSETMEELSNSSSLEGKRMRRVIMCSLRKKKLEMEGRL